MPDDKWRQMRDRKRRDLRESWANRKDVEDEEDAAPGGGGGADIFAPLLDALCIEIEAYDKFVDVQGDNYLASLAPGGAPFTAPYGSSLGPKVRTRYEFWPSKRKKWPLLFYCACQLLAGTKASSCSNERLHSFSGRIWGKLKADSVEKLTLAYYYVREMVKEWLLKAGKEAEALLDKLDLEEEQAAGNVSLSRGRNKGSA